MSVLHGLGVQEKHTARNDCKDSLYSVIQHVQSNMNVTIQTGIQNHNKYSMLCVVLLSEPMLMHM